MVPLVAIGRRGSTEERNPKNVCMQFTCFPLIDEQEFKKKKQNNSVWNLITVVTNTAILLFPLLLLLLLRLPLVLL